MFEHSKRTVRRKIADRGSQRGQTVVFVVLGLGIVFLAVLGFAVDFGNLWFHRQAAQNAADAACTAAVMDMLYNTQAIGATPVGNFPGTNPFNCSSNPTAAPCQYAALNGYTATGVSTPGVEGNEVQIAFLASSDPGAPPVPVCPTPIPPGMTICVPPSALAASPFVRATVTDRIRTAFFGLLSSTNTIDVPAKATCGLVLQSSPIPLLVLDPTRPSTLTSNGGGGISIYGGPSQSIQVNSNNAAALNWNGNKLQVDLSQGGPTTSGSDFGVFGIQSTAPSTSTTAGCVAPPSGPDICLGTTGSYVSPKFPISDPFATITAPQIPTWSGNGTVTSVASGTHGCPAPAGIDCDMYSPGYYPTGITVKNKYAIFQPGIYYVLNGMDFDSNSCVRPSTDFGDGSGGTFFYFADNKSITVVSNSGCNTNSQTVTSSNWQTETSNGGEYPFGVACDSTSLAGAPANLPTEITGSVLLAPCRAPTTDCVPNCSINGGMGYGDPLGSSDPAGEQRGLLMMQNRSANLLGPPSHQPSWQGGGAFLISGSLYFHRCTTGSTDTGTGCTAAAYNDQLSIGGNASGTSYILGDIVVDQLSLNGTPNLYMDLSPNALYFIFKASLLQ
ncbi:MAG: pilus assembly protein TadG-related protein [Terriglobia bacterium]|nr:pilus assembly protein TadG-related protein [Terriglobia bacterium]